MTVTVEIQFGLRAEQLLKISQYDVTTGASGGKKNGPDLKQAHKYGHRANRP